MIAPTPNAASTLEILYYEQPALGRYIAKQLATEYAPELILYASLLEATPFLKNDDRVQLWQGLYDRCAQAFSGQDLGRILDRSAQRSEA